MRNGVEQAGHYIGFSDDVVEGVALLQGFFKLHHLLLRTLLGDGGTDVREEFFVIPRLLDEVVSTGVQRVDDVADGAVSGDHDDWQFGPQALDAGQQVDAALAGKREVEQEQVVLAGAKQVKPGVALRCHFDGKAFQRQQCFQ